MSNRLNNYIITTFLTITLLILFNMNSFCNTEPNISVYIEGNYKKNLSNRSFDAKLNVQRNQDILYEKLKQKYNQLFNLFNKEYNYNKKLISESSTVQQVYEHSKNLLNTCVKYSLNQSNLKDEVLLLYLVGPWKGYTNITINEKTADIIYKAKRNLFISFESNQAGQISKGFIQGTEKITKKVKNNSKIPINKDTQTNISNITGSVTGNIVPNSSFNLLLKFDKNYPDDNFLKKYNSFELKGKNYVSFTPIVSSKTLDDAFSLYVSNMKIYYNLLLKNDKDPRLFIQDRYNIFFNDILTLLYYVNNAYISKEAAQSQKIYNKSEFVSGAFERYAGYLISYYNENIDKCVSPRVKMDLYKNLLEEMIQICSFCHLNILDNTIIDKLDLNLDKPNNIIYRTFYRYYNEGNRYYLKKLSSNLSKKDRSFYKKKYLNFMNEVIEIKNTGLISPLTIKE